MNENNSTELKIFSKRAQAFLSSPRHILTKKPGESADKKWVWDFTLEKNQQNDLQSDKILTLAYFAKTTSVLESLLLEALARMTIGRDIFFLQNLSFRELENFLRDENHLPIFDNSTTIFAEESYKVVKNSLLVGLIIKVMKENEKKEGDTFHLIGWNKLTLVEKNQKARAFIEHINNLFPRAKSLQLAIAEKEKIAIVMNDFPLGASVIEELAHESFGNTEEISSLKVVAVQ